MDTLKNLLSGAAILAVAAVIAQGCASPDNTPLLANDASANNFPGQGGGSAGGGYSTGGDTSGNQNGTGGDLGSSSGGTPDNSGSGGSAATCKPTYCPSAGSGAPCCMSDGVTCGVDYGMGCTTPIPDAGSNGGFTGSGGDTGSTGGSLGLGGSTVDASQNP